MKVLQYPNEFLEQVCEEVELPLSGELKSLARDMMDSVLADEKSAGLAAPQVGVLSRMCVVSDHGKNPLLLVNPIILFKSPMTDVFPEGCLSIENGDTLYEVERSRVVKIEYYDARGKKKSLKVNDWFARLVQHELDHLDGVVINKIGKQISLGEAREKYN